MVKRYDPILSAYRIPYCSPRKRGKYVTYEDYARLEEALKSISEYWNGDPNDAAMKDALEYIEDVALDALTGDRE